MSPGPPQESPAIQAPLPGETLAKFWELLGRRVFERNGVWWGQHRGTFYRSLPFHRVVDLGPEEVHSILHTSSVRGLSFPSDRPGLPGGIYVIRPEGYGLPSVSRKQRGHVTRGLEVCDLRALDSDELLVLGMPLNRETLDRQSRDDATFLDPAQWKRFVHAVSRCPGMAIHGAFVDGQLATYLISCREGPWLHLMYKMSSTAAREHYPNHALDYSIILNAAADPEIQFIGNGTTSILPNDGLDRYKRQMGYQMEPHNLCIHFHPWLAALLDNKVTATVVKGAQALLPHNERLAYAAKVLEGSVISRSL